MVRGADISHKGYGGNGHPGYEFIGIPYNGWACKGPFVTDGVGIDTLVVTSSEGKLGIVDFSNACASFLRDSSIPQCNVLIDPFINSHTV
jgi:hypothetical protein